LQAVPVKGLAHITGGGLVGNVPRILPAGTRAVIRRSAWPRPEPFRWLQQAGGVAEDEMWRVFNCGIGMVAVVPRDQATEARSVLEREGERVYEIGAIEKSSGEPDAVIA
jgi:phosphoribosylformylglycinamidine cyclo-ligase